MELRKKKNPLIKKSGDSIWTQIKQNASYLKSPIFIVLVISFAIGNFNVSICLNVMRWVVKLLPIYAQIAPLSYLVSKYQLETLLSDLVCRSADGDLDEFTTLQQSSEIWRVIAGVIISPIVGLISDILIKFWKNFKNGSQDVLYTIPCFLTLATVTVGLAFSLLWTNIWPTMTFVAFSTALIYTYENMSIVSSLG